MGTATLILGESGTGKSTSLRSVNPNEAILIKPIGKPLPFKLKWFTEFGHLNRGDMLTSEQHRCHNEKKKFQRRV